VGLGVSINVSTVMDGLGVRLATITGLRVFDFVPDSFSPPAAVVSLPQMVEYDLTMARGADRGSFQVYVLVGKASDRSARDQLAAYIAGTGSSSVKTAIEAGKTLGGAAHSTRVTGASVSVVTTAGSEFLTAIFDVDVVA
jgi:hypothetical protein